MAGQAPRIAHVERHLRDVSLVRLEVQALEQQLLQGGRQRPFAFEAYRRQARALLQDALHVLAIVLVALVGAFGGVEVGVAGDADDVRVLDGVHGEYLARHHLDGVLQQDELQSFARQRDHALALARHGDEAQRHALGSEVLPLLLLGRLFAVLGLRRLLLRARLLVEAQYHVQRAVLQVREGMARVDDLRRQERHHVLVHVIGQEGALLVVEVFGAQAAHAARAQLFPHAFVGAFLDGVQLVAARVDGVELLGGRHAGLRVDDVLLH